MSAGREEARGRHDPWLRSIGRASRKTSWGSLTFTDCTWYSTTPTTRWWRGSWARKQNSTNSHHGHDGLCHFWSQGHLFDRVLETNEDCGETVHGQTGFWDCLLFKRAWPCDAWDLPLKKLYCGRNKNFSMLPNLVCQPFLKVKVLSPTCEDGEIDHERERLAVQHQRERLQVLRHVQNP